MHKVRAFFYVCAGILSLALALLATPPSAQAEGGYLYVTQWGSQGNGDGQLSGPAGVAIDAAGNVYVSDQGNDRIQKFTSTGTYLTQWGSFGGGNGQFDVPMGVAADAAGNVYVADASNYRIQKFTSTGTYLTQWGSNGSGNGQFNGPIGVATDAAGYVYVADYGDDRIQKFTGTGTYVTQWGSFGSGDGQFNNPYGVAIDAAGNVYVADYDNSRIQKFNTTGGYLTQWGSPGSGNAESVGPFGVATDAAGNVYVTEFSTMVGLNHRIQKFTGTGTYATQWGSFGSSDGQFNSPFGVATDAEGNVYVADTINNRIQKFAPLSVPAASARGVLALSALLLGGGVVFLARRGAGRVAGTIGS